ncbi:MAG: hypothetical protein JWO13_3701 [Acidobacteriales bacterium]|nr:hypothetical protein [Terriglobales bacterium]
MKRSLLSVFILSIGAVLASSGCGGSSNSTSTTSNLTIAKKRAFLLNQFTGSIDVIDVEKDITVNQPIGVGSQPTIMQVLSNKKTLVYSSANGSLSIVDNATETASALTSLSAPTESIVVSPDAKFAYAAQPALGKIAVVDLTATTPTVTLIPADTATPASLPNVRRLAITKSGSAILGFSDNSDTVAFVDTASANAVTTKPGFDRPYTAVFSSDDATAYVLNCGKECGGVSAGVTPVTLGTKTLGTKVNVKAATVAALDGSNLYVAGTDVTTNLGQLSVLSLASLTPTSQTALTISDGLHTTMALGANNKLYIGSRACTNSGGKCLSVYDTGKQTATILTGTTNSPAFGDVQAITPIKNRTVVYIIQNGVIQVYDTTTDLPQAIPTILVSGKTVDVKEVD